MASRTDIFNRALQKLGVSSIASHSENSAPARACNRSYEIARRAELRSHPWNFNIERVSIAADATPPAFGKDNRFPLPANFLNLRPADPFYNTEDIDYQIEGRYIMSDFSSPLEIRYGSDVTEESVMDPCFVEALACRMAVDMCAELTESNVKKQDLKEDYLNAIREARRANAFENRPQDSAPDFWETVRL